MSTDENLPWPFNREKFTDTTASGWKHDLGPRERKPNRKERRRAEAEKKKREREAIKKGGIRPR